jgi:cyanophycinase
LGNTASWIARIQDEAEDVDDGDAPGRLLIIGGVEDRCCGSGLLERFVELCGGDQARLVLVTTASDMPEEVLEDYQRVFSKLGVEHTSELRLRGRGDADGHDAAEVLCTATGVFFSGGDQAKLRTLVGSRTNDLISQRLQRDGLVVGGTSAGATAIGRTMILGGARSDVSAAAVRTGPGLGLVPQALIDMHFAERGRLPRLLSAVAQDPERLGIGLDENTGVLIEGDCFEVIGTGVATVVDAEDATVVHAADDCDPITLFGVRLHLLPAGCLFGFGSRTPAIGPAHNRY